MHPFLKNKKEVLWKDVQYKLVKKDARGNPMKLCLHDAGRRKLIVFDWGIVGFDRMIKMVKNKPRLPKCG